jgi:ATP-dependent Clp protease adapter protein ClpS
MEDNSTHKLILHNDKKNTFTYVMACLIRFCEHHPTQAEQCALLAHEVGRCTVKHGDLLTMLEISESLRNLDLKTSVEQYAGNMH